MESVGGGGALGTTIWAAMVGWRALTPEIKRAGSAPPFASGGDGLGRLDGRLTPNTGGRGGIARYQPLRVCRGSGAYCTEYSARGSNVPPIWAEIAFDDRESSLDNAARTLFVIR